MFVSSKTAQCELTKKGEVSVSSLSSITQLKKLCNRKYFSSVLVKITLHAMLILNAILNAIQNVDTEFKVLPTDSGVKKIGPWDLSSLATTCLRLVKVVGGVILGDPALAPAPAPPSGVGWVMDGPRGP